MSSAVRSYQWIVGGIFLYPCEAEFTLPDVTWSPEDEICHNSTFRRISPGLIIEALKGPLKTI